MVLVNRAVTIAVPHCTACDAVQRRNTPMWNMNIRTRDVKCVC